MNILILEDDSAPIMLLELLLKRKGYPYTICVGIEGEPIDPNNVAVLDQNRDLIYIDLAAFDLAFLDGNLVGELLGIVLVEPLKQLGAVTICTSANLALVAEFKELGVDYVREKGELIAFIKDDLGGAIALRESRLANR